MGKTSFSDEELKANLTRIVQPHMGNGAYCRCIAKDGGVIFDIDRECIAENHWDLTIEFVKTAITIQASFDTEQSRAECSAALNGFMRMHKMMVKAEKLTEYTGGP